MKTFGRHCPAAWTLCAAFVVSAPAIAETQDPSQEAAQACGVSAMTSHTKATLALEMQQPLLSVAGTIRLRRLNEQYCLEFSKCMLLATKPPETQINNVMAAEFSSCLHDEEHDGD
jgi:hypothetical protein